MAKRYSGKDVTNWKVVTHGGKQLLDAKGKPLNGFTGYLDASKVAAERGAVAVRA